MIDAFFNEPLRRTTSAQLTTVPPANVWSNETGYSIQLAAPGYSRDDFNLSAENGTLTVTLSGDASSNFDSDNCNVVRTEYAYTEFTRSWSLPQGVNANQINARYDAGILTIDVPVEGKQNSSVVIDVQ
jgi:HSP20 family protein